MRTRLVATALALVPATALSAQCDGANAAQRLATPFAGTTYYGSTRGPTYGTSLDPGPGIRCDVALEAPVEITAVGVHVLGDGGSYRIPVPNLVGGRNGTLEVWIAEGRSVREPELFANQVYTHLPPVPPRAPWRLLSKAAAHVANLEFAPYGSPSVARFDPPLVLPAGRHALVLVAVPPGVATSPPGLGDPADPATERVHLLMTNLDRVPGDANPKLAGLAVSNLGTQSPAFAPNALDATSTPPLLPDLWFDFALARDAAHAVAVGTGCAGPSAASMDGEVAAVPASLSLDARPVVGEPLAFVTDHLPADAVLNATVVSLAPAPGIDLFPLLPRGCRQYVQLPELVAVLQFVENGRTTWQPLAAIPSAFRGQSLHAQAVQFCARTSPANSGPDLLVSNGLCVYFDHH